MTPPSHAKALAKLLASTWTDPDLKKRLKSDPAGTLKAHGISVPGGAEIRVVEDTPTVAHLVIPAKPKDPLAGDADSHVHPMVCIPVC